MKLIFRLALDEIKSNKKYSLLFIFQLCLGISGFILLNSFRDSFNQHLTQRSRSLLTSDISVSARRSLSAEEIHQLGLKELERIHAEMRARFDQFIFQ